MAKGRKVRFKTKKKSKSGGSKKGRKAQKSEEEKINRGLEEICSKLSILKVTKSERQLKKERKRGNDKRDKNLCRLLRNLACSDVKEDTPLAVDQVKDQLQVRLLDPSDLVSEDFVKRQKNNNRRFKKTRSKCVYKKERKSSKRGATYRFLKGIEEES